MTPEHWQRIDQLFQAAIELKPEERDTFLDQACGEDQDLRSEVEALIASDEHGLSFIEDPAFEMAANLLVRNKPELSEGDRLAHYTIARLLGKGGMGEVIWPRTPSWDARSRSSYCPQSSETKKGCSAFGKRPALPQLSTTQTS